MREVISTARADGASLGDDLVEHNISVTHPMGAYRTSMQIDRQNGRPMEIQAIIGHPAEIARKNRISIPHIHALHRLLKIIR